MKYLTISVAALFLFAAPAAVFAQSDTTGGTATGTGLQNGGATTEQNTGGTGEAGSAGDQARTGSDSQCNDQTASAGYDSFSEKCRGQIDAWAARILKASGAVVTDIVFTNTPWQKFLMAQGVQGAIQFPIQNPAGNSINPGSQIDKGAVDFDEANAMIEGSGKVLVMA